MFADTIDYMNDTMAERMGRSPDDPAVRVFCGALMGTIMGQYLAFGGEDDLPALLAHLDEALILLEKGVGS